VLTVIDATNVQPKSRAALIAVARAHDVLPVAIVLDVPEEVCSASRTRGWCGTAAGSCSPG
jgi:protein phosphatase